MDNTEKAPRHLFTVGAYERDVMGGRFAGSREEWRRWQRDPGAFQHARREQREKRLRQQEWSKRTSTSPQPVDYADPLAPLERVQDYRSPVFDEETREWLAYHIRLCSG